MFVTVSVRLWMLYLCANGENNLQHSETWEINLNELDTRNSRDYTGSSSELGRWQFNDSETESFTVTHPFHVQHYVGNGAARCVCVCVCVLQLIEQMLHFNLTETIEIQNRKAREAYPNISTSLIWDVIQNPNWWFSMLHLYDWNKWLNAKLHKRHNLPETTIQHLFKHFLSSQSNM